MASSEDALIEALEIAERAQLIGAIKRSGAISFAFVHALIPLTLHEGLSTLRRQRLHRHAAQAIEQVHADRLSSGDLAAILGRHYAEAGDREKAIEHYLQAAERARSVYAYQEAIEHYQQALAFLKEQGHAGIDPRRPHGDDAGRVVSYRLRLRAFAAGVSRRLCLVAARGRRAAQGHTAARAARVAVLWRNLKCLTRRRRIGENGMIINQLFSGLVDCTDLDIMPDLAHRWEILDGGRRYVFHLRPDATLERRPAGDGARF